ncbi:MAG: DUF4355 domain-containing protein [Thermomicrobiales bacterium]
MSEHGATSGDTSEQPDGDTPGQQGGDQQFRTFSQEEVNALIDERLKRATAKWEKEKADAIEKAKKESLPEIEQARAEQQELQRQVQILTESNRVARGRELAQHAAKTAGAPDPDLVYRVIRSDITFGDDNEPENVHELIRALQGEKPELFKVKPPRGDQGGEAAKGDPARTDPNAWIRRAAGRRQ